MKTLLQTIDQYDRAQHVYIRELEVENERLREKVNELVAQLVSYVDTVDRMKLDLISGGALAVPKQQPKSEAAP